MTKDDSRTPIRRWVWIAIGAIAGILIGIAIMTLLGFDRAGALAPVLSGVVGAGSALVATELSARRASDERTQAAAAVLAKELRDGKAARAVRATEVNLAALQSLVLMTAQVRVANTNTYGDELETFESFRTKTLMALERAALEGDNPDLVDFPERFEIAAAASIGQGLQSEVRPYIQPYEDLIARFREALRKKNRDDQAGT